MKAQTLLLTLFILITTTGISQRPSIQTNHSRSGNGPAAAVSRPAVSRPAPAAVSRPAPVSRPTAAVSPSAVSRGNGTPLPSGNPPAASRSNSSSFSSGNPPVVRQQNSYAQPRVAPSTPSHSAGTGTSVYRNSGTPATTQTNGNPNPVGNPGADPNDGNPGTDDRGKITICHIPPGNPANSHTITIAESAWPAHQAHGDVQGACTNGGGNPTTAGGNPGTIGPKPTVQTVTGGTTNIRPKPTVNTIGGATTTIQPKPAYTNVNGGNTNITPAHRTPGCTGGHSGHIQGGGCHSGPPVITNNYCGGRLYTYGNTCGAPTGYWYGGINNYYCGSYSCAGSCGANSGWVLSISFPVAFAQFYFYLDYTRSCEGLEYYYHRYRNFTRNYGDYKVEIIHEPTGSFHWRNEYQKVALSNCWGCRTTYSWQLVSREQIWHGPDCGLCYGDWF